MGVKGLELGKTFTKQHGLVRQAKPLLKGIVKKGNGMVYIGMIRESSVILQTFHRRDF
ncbi:MAG: hypothetical protein ACETWT_09455 [Thermodesulfobacteriota bacterium]